MPRNMTQGGSSKKVKPNNALIIGAVLTVSAVAVAGIAAFALTPASTGESNAVQNVAVQQLAPANSPSKEPWLKTSWLRIENELPGVTCKTSGDGMTVNMFYDDRIMAKVFVGRYRDVQSDEALGKYYQLSKMNVRGAAEPIEMTLYFMPTSGGKGVAHWSENAKTTVLEAAGLTDQQLCDAMTLIDDSGQERSAQCQLVQDPTGGVSPTPKASSDSGKYAYNSTEPFYGVWLGAFKTREEAEEQVFAITKGYGVVVLTTDWSNLNSESWYVVSYGTYKTQEEAERVYQGVCELYAWNDAYVKYSGEHR